MLSRLEPTVYGSKLFFFTSAFILDGSILVLFLFALFEELVWNERRKKATPGVWLHNLSRTK